MKIYAATLTPFVEGTLDLARYREHLSWLVASGVDGLCPCGTTGEFLYLTAEEKRALIQATVDASGDAEVVACVWDNHPGGCAELARAAEASGGALLPALAGR